MSPIRQGPPRKPTGEPKPNPPDAEPATPPDAAPASSPAPAEMTPTPSAETFPDADLTAALAIVWDRGVRKSALQDELGISKERADALLVEMKAKGLIGPAPKPGKKREILVTKWPPEAAPTEPTPEPEAPLAEQPHAEASPRESFHWYETPRRSMVDAAKRFISKFRGEAQSQDEKEYKASGTDVAKSAATGFLSVVASYTGVKILADLPAWLYQKYWTNPAERQRIKDALATKETELGETTEPTAIDQKKAKLEEAINASKFLSKEKKTELLHRLHATVDEYEAKDKTLRTERNEKIAKLLDQAIETRVKNTQVLKEALNSALMVTGLSAMRGVAYGAVAVYERHQEVMQSPGRHMQYWKEMTYRGFTETMHNLIGGKADTWTGKGMNFVKGATNVLRAAGFADLAIAEWTSEGRSVSSIIETSLKAWEDKGVSAGWDNIKAPWQRLGHLGEYAKSAVTGSEPAPGPTPQTPGVAGGAAGSPEAAGAAGAAGVAGVAATESAPHVEIPEAKIEAGLVHKGDGILKILERQGMEAKSALEAAREAGIVRAGGDTRLTTEAIGRLSVFAETQPDGDIEIKFFDSETDKLLTLEEAREAGFTYESGTVPGEIPTDKEIVEHVPEPTPDVEALVDSPAPNDLLGGTFHLYTDAEGHFTSIDAGDGDMLSRMNDAIQELSRTGHGDSPEIKFIFEQYKALLASEGVESAEHLPPAQAAERGAEEVQARVATEPEAPTDAEPLRKFNGEVGRVKFVYDKETGEVKDAFMPAYTPRPRDIEDSLREWGLTNKEVKAHFFEGASRTHMDGTTIDTSHPGRYPEVNPTESRASFPIQSPENDYRQFVRDAERLSRQESLLEEMEMEGYARTPEYARLKMETETLEKYVTRNMTRQFNIKEREI